MAEVIALSARPRKRAGAALVAAVANARRDPDDVFWLKENAELLNVLETTGQGDAGLLAPYAAIAAALPERLRFFPHYYRFLLSIALDLEDMGLPGTGAGALAAEVARTRPFAAELSDLQRAEARRLLARRGLGGAVGDPGLDDRLRAFAGRPETFAIPNRKAAYELTHIVFYLSEYGRRDPGLDDNVLKSLHFTGLVALLDHNADLLAETCIALRFAGAAPPRGWQAMVAGRLRAVRIAGGAQASLPDSYHDWLMAEWLQGVSGQPLFAGRYPPGAISFHMAPADGPLRSLSQDLHGMGDARRSGWARMRPHLLPRIAPDGQATLRLAEASGDLFEEFFALFARAGGAGGP
ncbi:hypothetical protein SAMN05216196_10834 [Lutimaribacter pacificus]|uniref:Uncharacterized protein n=1 Tax=Lutimaribacter pacificus TaxID=391948 RepID=A0A1H0LL96_9RHOB|nr:hypothetical protein [Lutimaribacter pacificus]SDO68660.1 hypothetical protein SAMN05216196_10834 [Lutimaribacter pacificus]SHK06155.1 hypothetical protein SAMN05444142_103123 [Lutimaribacter pacificus]